MANNETQVAHFPNGVDHFKGQSEVFKLLFGYLDTLVIRSVVELRIADIIHSHGQPMSLSQIASKIESPNVDIDSLRRVMRMLVRKKVFSIIDSNQSLLLDEGQALYGLTTISAYLRHDHKFSLAPSFLRLTNPSMVKPWYEISRSIKEGGINPFVLAHGQTLWDMTSNNPEFNNLFNSGMASANKQYLDAIIKGYNDGFSKLEGTLVDVGGGTGSLVAKIVEAYPHIKGVNFDLPHNVENAPQHPGVTHVGGDMFKNIPTADNVIMKFVLHDWADEDCIMILKNCKKAVSEKKGKVIIVDIILHPDRYELFDDATIALDLLMMTNCVGGKERTKGEWKTLLEQAGFTQFNIIPLQAIMSLSIIEVVF